MELESCRCQKTLRITVTEILPGHMKGWGQLKLKMTKTRDLMRIYQTIFFDPKERAEKGYMWNDPMQQNIILL